MMKSTKTSKHTKVKLIETLVFSIALYGRESWTMKKRDRKRIDAFELWCWRRVLKIPWTQKETNKFVIAKIGPKTSLEAIIIKQILSFFGHIMRRDVSLEKSIMLGKCDGARRRGRPWQRWLAGVVEATGLPLDKLKDLIRDRTGWR